MRLSYNIIKSNVVEAKEKINIVTEACIKKSNDTNEKELQHEEVSYEEAQAYINNYEKIGRDIVEEAKRKRDEYIIEMTEKAKEIEKAAYEQGYSQGVINGKEDGKKEAYESCIPNAIRKAEELIKDAENILTKAQEDYEAYLEDKKDEILNLSIAIAEQIIKRELTDKSGLNSLIEDAIKVSKGSENIIIKCNSIHEEEIKKQSEVWKVINNIIGEIFIIKDDSMEPGNAVIEKSTGKIEVGIDIGLEKIKEAIL